ncbi:hypothetical protein PHYSODRAFT_258457, partial [Phytophthora sojae]
ISNTMYGALLSSGCPACSCRCWAGKSGHRSFRFFLVWICVGRAIFALGVQLKKNWLALFGRVFFGVGESSVVVGARAFVASWLRNKELTIAMGVSVAITKVSKMLAKATLAPIALYFGGYVQALWYGVLVCVLSAVVGMLVCHYTLNLKRIVKGHVLKDYADKKRQKHRWHKPHAHARQISCENVKIISRMFWDYSIGKAGVVSSISHLFVMLAPFIGLRPCHRPVRRTHPAAYPDCYGAGAVELLAVSTVFICSSKQLLRERRSTKVSKIALVETRYRHSKKQLDMQN